MSHTIHARALVASLRRRLGNVAHVVPPTSVFDGIYHSNHWGGDESRSGTGSSLAQTRVVRQVLPELLSELGCRSMLDAPCGDFNWLSQVPLDVEYFGYDIVGRAIASNTQRYGSDRVRFVRGDITSSRLPRVDLILCRDCLVHLSYSDAFLALRNFLRSGARYLLTTTFPGRANRDIVTGAWRPLDLERPPFKFPKPARVINEVCTESSGSYQDKSLGLWDLSQW
ncbi:MAG: class I SAM-dependent methyltransferase [Steroidobacteraceae bacterium]